MKKQAMALSFVLLSGVLIMSNSAYAAARDGVLCPSGFTANFNRNQGRLSCSKRVTENAIIRDAVCPNNLFEKLTYHRVAGGRDYCTKDSNGARVRVVPGWVTDPQNYRLEVDYQGTLDKFKKGGNSRTEYAYPVRL